MEIKRIYINNDENVFLDAYIGNEIPNLTRKAILVIPGGGYHHLAAYREGYPVAEAFVARGYNAFVLSYSVNRVKAYPAQLIEASLAIKHIKDHAEEYGIDKEKVFAVGFSAGGHLCASLGTMWHRAEVCDAIPDMPFGYNKPAGIMPIYSVVSGVDHPNQGSFKNLLCKEEPTVEELEYVSVEKAVDKRSAPAFIAHTASDGAVRVENALLLAGAYAAVDVPFELHIYPFGPHALALGNEVTYMGNPDLLKPDFAKWVEQACYWADHILL